MIIKIINDLFLNAILHLNLWEIFWEDDVGTFIANLSVTFKRLTKYKHKEVLAAIFEGKSMPSNMAAGMESIPLYWKIKVP